MNLSVKIPVWFWIVAAILLVWNIMGVMAFYVEMNMVENKAVFDELPVAWQEMYLQQPMWIKIAFGAAVWSGLFASIALLIKKAWAVPLFLLSLLTLIVYDIGIFGLQKAYEIVGSGPIIMSLIVLVICIFQVWFSRKAKSNTWLS